MTPERARELAKAAVPEQYAEIVARAIKHATVEERYEVLSEAYDAISKFKSQTGSASIILYMRDEERHD